MPRTSEELKRWIDWEHSQLSVRRQCDLLGVHRSRLYYEVLPESAENLALMRLIDEQYLATPFFGSRQMTAWLRRSGHAVNRKRIQRLMRKMGLEGIAPGPSTSRPQPGHEVYPYLLRNLSIVRVNQVWSSDITYVPLRKGFLYLVAVIDWFSRYVLSWRLSNSLDVEFCLEALEEALQQGKPEIFNTDQGAQFTSRQFTRRLQSASIAVSMDGRGRARDNVFIERLWRSVKYEDIYLKEYATGADCEKGLSKYFNFYCHARPHQALDFKTPWEVHQTRRSCSR